jgi:hypothetical protein
MVAEGLKTLLPEEFAALLEPDFPVRRLVVFQRAAS